MMWLSVSTIRDSVLIHVFMKAPTGNIARAKAAVTIARISARKAGERDHGPNKAACTRKLYNVQGNTGKILSVAIKK